MASDIKHFGHARWSEVAALLGPALFLFAAFVLLPFIMAVGFSFTNIKLLQTDKVEWVGLDNYTRMFSLKLVEAPAALVKVQQNPARQWRQLKRADPVAFDGFQYLTDLDLAGSQ